MTQSRMGTFAFGVLTFGASIPMRRSTATMHYAPIGNASPLGRLMSLTINMSAGDIG